jgi:D-arginine dehydrogenase
VEDGRAIGVSTSHGEYRAPWIVNAAGAWSDVIGRMAGAVRIGLTPMRRTIVTFATPAGLEARAWPLVADLSHSLYFSPESSGLLASPMDEDPMEPCDAKPDDIVVATTMERLRHVAPILVPKSLKKKWAGLRTFAPDQAMVVGEDPLVKGFFWLAGQGGAGIETSPAVGRMAAELITNGTTERMDARVLDPRRFV